MAKRKAKLKKVVQRLVYADGSQWTVKYGILKRRKGRPGRTDHLFKVLGEKLPYSSLSEVRKDVHKKLHKKNPQGVYIAHDSMGCPRYIGRGNVFNRLESRRRTQQLELQYFSFYLVSEMKHEREIETLLIRAAGFLLEFNDKKKRVGISHGDIKDYEAGTEFYERQWKKGKKKRMRKIKRLR